jgi:molecular chaperone DnaK
MYKAAQPGTGAGAAPGAGAGPQPGADGNAQKKDEGVIDAEYVDVEDKK